jgi:N-acyl homoserine lactone hydrolase
MKRIWKLGAVTLGVLAVLAIAGLAALLIRNRPLPPAPEHAFVKPSYNDLPKISACWVEFDHRLVPAQAMTAGITHLKVAEVTASGLVIRHLGGNILVDTGSSTHLQQEIADYPFWSHLHFEILTDGKNGAAETSANVLRQAEISPEALTAVILSHIHMDHAGGLVDLPNVPVYLSSEEIDFMTRYRRLQTIQVVPAEAKALDGRVHALHFESKPYETFDESADIFGDGSVVVVKLPGHTPGSIGIFVNLSPTFRIFHAGDAVNANEAIERRLPKSFAMAATDDDASQANATVAKLSQLHTLDPELLMIPAHDRGAWKQAFGAAPGCIP